MNPDISITQNTLHKKDKIFIAMVTVVNILLMITTLSVTGPRSELRPILLIIESLFLASLYINWRSLYPQE